LAAACCVIVCLLAAHHPGGTMGVACGRAGPAGLPSGTGSIHARLGADCQVRQHPGHGNHSSLARQALPARVRKSRPRMSRCLIHSRSSADRSYSPSPCPPAGWPGAASAANPSSPGPESWITECPSRMISRCRVFAGAGKSPSVNIRFFKPDWASLSNTQAH